LPNDPDYLCLRSISKTITAKRNSFFVELLTVFVNILLESDLAKQKLPKEKNMAVLKLDKHDEKKEVKFELDYLMSLTTRQRFEMMSKKTREILSLLKRNGNRKTTQITKRT